MNKYKDQSEQAQKKRRLYKKCLSKKGFDSEEDALKQKGMSAYRCSNCGRWHRTKSLTYYLRKKHGRENG